MTLDAQLDALEALGLVRVAQVEPELHYLFQHTLVQEVAYNSLLKADRQWVHRCVGETLERLYADQITGRELAPLLGHHFAEAGDNERALRYFSLAGDAALQVYANAEAIAHYSRALEIARLVFSSPDSAGESTTMLTHLYTSRGRALELSACYDQAMNNYAEMEAVARQRSDQALELAALLAQLTLYITPDTEFDFAKAHALSEQALALARQLGDGRAEARIYWDLMRLAHWTGIPHKALEYGEQALALARQLDYREQLAFILHDIHRPYVATRQRRRAAETLDEATHLWRELNNLPMLADALASAADLYYDNGEYDRAFALAQEAVRISQSIGNQWGQAFGLAITGQVWLEQGEISRAMQAIEQAIDLSRAAGVVVLYLRLRILQAWIHELLGDHDAAFRLIHVAIADIKQAGLSAPYWTGFPLTVLAQLYLRQGNSADAEAVVDRMMTELQIQDRHAPLWGWQVEAELALARGNYDLALATLERAMVELGKNDTPVPLVTPLYLKGKALAGQGRRDAARETWTRALAEAETIGTRIRAWPILAALSQLEAECGHKTAAAEWNRRARQTIEYILGHIEQPALREAFCRLPDVRAVLDAE